MKNINGTTSFPLRVCDSEILDQSLEFAAKTLAEDVSRSLNISEVPISFTTGKQYLRAIAQKSGGKLSLPACSIQIRNMKAPEESYNAFAMRHFGVGGIFTDDSKKTVIKYNLRPLLVSCVFHFLSQDHKEVLLFSQNWISNLRRAFFITGSDGFEIGIGLKRDKSIDFSDVELDNMTPFFDLEANVDIQTYTGDLLKVQTVQSIRERTYLTSFGNDPQKVLQTTTTEEGTYVDMQG